MAHLIFVILMIVVIAALLIFAFSGDSGPSQRQVSHIEHLLEEIRDALTPDTSGLDSFAAQSDSIVSKYQGLTDHREGAVMSSPTPNPAQAAIDADVAKLTDDFATLVSVFTKIQTLVANANANSTPVSTAALDALVSGQAATVVADYQGLVPPAPAP